MLLLFFAKKYVHKSYSLGASSSDLFIHQLEVTNNHLKGHLTTPKRLPAESPFLLPRSDLEFHDPI